MTLQEVTNWPTTGNYVENDVPLTDDYVAGFFDGEGCILIKRTKSGCGMELAVQVGQAHEDVPYALQDRFGGSVSYAPPEKRPRRKDGGLGSQFWTWAASGRNAYRFLQTIKERLIVKKSEAEAAMRFYEIKGYHRIHTPEDVVAMKKAYENLLVIRREDLR